MTAPPPPPQPDLARLELICESFLRLTGRRLIEPAADLRQALWNAPAVIVAHDTSPDPVFFFGNRAALGLFEMPFEDFTRMPSRFSAEPLSREARQALLARVTRDGFIDDYRGVRISARGQRFMIEAAVVWNLEDAHGQRHGQAATFSRWTMLPPDSREDFSNFAGS